MFFRQINTSASNYCSLMEYWPDKLIPFPLLFQWPVQTGLDFPIVAPSSSSWSLYTTITSTTTVLEKSQLLKGFQVEQKYSRLPTQLHVSPLTPPVPLNIPKSPMNILYTFSFYIFDHHIFLSLFVSISLSSLLLIIIFIKIT